MLPDDGKGGGGKGAVHGNSRIQRCSQRWLCLQTFKPSLSVQSSNSKQLQFVISPFLRGKKDFSNAALSGLGITLMFFRKFIEAVISLMKLLQFLRASLEVTCRSWCFCDDLTVGNAIYFHKFTDISASTQVNPSPLSLSCTKNSIIARVCLFWNSQSSSSQFPQ